MGQVYIPGAPGITVNPVDRESGPGAGSGASGNRSLFLGAAAGQNSTASDFIALGNNAGAGGLADANANGMIVIGSQAAALMTGQTGTTSGPSTIIGFNALKSVNIATVARNTILGSQILANAAPTAGSNYTQNVVIGEGACQGVQFTNGKPFSNNVLIGVGMFPTVQAGSIISSVCIGRGIGSAYTGVGSVSNCILIGDSAAPSIGNSNLCIGIGQAVLPSIGAATRCIAIGNDAGHSVQNGSDNITLGAGTGALSGDTSGTFELGSSGAGVLLYGWMSNGSLLVGQSTNAQRVIGPASTGSLPAQIGGTNQLGIVNGTRGAGNPVSGGFFYVSAGVLHWIDQNAVDTTLSLAANGQLASSALVAYTNNAGAQAATITNGPLAGNPTKWIPINDNGTIRNVPAW